MSRAEKPRATFKSSPEDFVVDEIPAYAPSGRGEHLFVTFQKTGLTTDAAVRSIARLLEVDARSAGFAGMKDKNAVTTQTASFQVPIARDPSALIAEANIPGITILSAARHENKLKPGHLIGNRFRVILRGIDGEDSLRAILEVLEAIRKEGVPNAFGPQRFGRDGDNPERFLAWLRSGDAARGRGGPRDKRDQRLLFSALQSLLFNRVLEQRERDGTWNTVLPGDLAKKHDTGGLFLVPNDQAGEAETKDAQERALAGGISATGPMFGARMRWPEGAPRDLELQVLKAVLDDASLQRPPIASVEDASVALEPLQRLGEGTRRALRLHVQDLTFEPIDDEETPSANALASTPSASASAARGSDQRERRGEAPALAPALRVGFVLPKGGYATTVLGRACQLVEPFELNRPPRGVVPGSNVALAGNQGNDDGADEHPEE